MTEAEWLAEPEDAQAMMRALLEPEKLRRTNVGERKLRLFACGRSRLLWHLLADPLSRQTVELAERFADGQADKDELRAACQQIEKRNWFNYPPTDLRELYRSYAAGLAEYTALDNARSAAYFSTDFQLSVAQFRYDPRQGLSLVCDLLRCVFGNPFRPQPVSATWKTKTVTALGLSVYEERAFDRLPILADALEEAGCTDAAILAHCRGPGPHARGCWVVDLLLGKE